MRFQSRRTDPSGRTGVARRATLYFAPLAVVVGGVMLGLFWLGSYSLAAEVEVASRRLLDKHVATLRHRLAGAAEDARILAGEAGRLGLFDRDPAALEHMTKLTAAMVRQRKVYQSIRVLDIGGRETLRLEFTASGSRFVGGPELIARPPWPHIEKLLMLKSGHVSVVSIDPDDVVPSAEGPAPGGLCLATPIRDDHCRQRGAVLVELRPTSLFGDLAGRPGGAKVMLVGSDGGLLGEVGAANFAEAHGGAWERMAANRSGRLYTADGLFLFLTIDPLFAMNDAPAPGGGGFPEPTWKLIGHIPSANLPARNRVRRTLFGSSLSVLLVLLAAAAWRLAQFSRMRFDAENRLRDARRNAELANASKTQFLANMSHEIRTPMTAVLGYTNLLMDPDLPDAERAECLRTLQRNGEHLLTLINDILDISKVEAGKLTVRQSTTNVLAVIAEVVSMMRIRAGRREVSLAVEYVGRMPATITSDGPRIRQALINLIGNAVKFTERGSIRVVGRFLPHWRGAPAVQIDVIDTGVGIAPEELPRIFQPFGQVCRPGAAPLPGSGLGLAISRSIVRLLGGELTAAGSPGDGSVFTMVVPTGDLAGVAMLDELREAAAPSQEPPAAPPKALKGLRILLAEDGPDNQRLIKTFLVKAAARVDVADDGAAALTKATSGEYDLIFMDMQMPEMDGFEATERLRQAGVETPVVALTAHALAGDRDRCIAAGCNDYLSKPIDRNRLIEIALRNSGSSRTRREADADAQAEVIVSESDPAEGIDALIDEFVDGLPETVAAMTDALLHSRFDELTILAHRLRGAGGGYGYPALTDAAAAVEDAATAEAAETASLALMILIAVCQAVSRGRRMHVETA